MTTSGNPYSCVNRIAAVITPGPVMMGVATMIQGASFSFETLLSLSPKTSSAPIRMRMRPPATLKLSIVTPNMDMSGDPMNTKTNSRIPATTTARLAYPLIVSLSTPLVIDRNVGMLENGFITRKIDNDTEASAIMSIEPRRVISLPRNNVIR